MQDEGQQYRRSTWGCPTPRRHGFDLAANVMDLLSELTQANAAPNKAGAWVVNYPCVAVTKMPS